MFALCYIIGFVPILLGVGAGCYSATNWEEYKKTTDSKTLIKSIASALVCAACIALLALCIAYNKEMGIWIQ